MSTIKVNGQEVDIDVREQLTIQDLSDDMDKVAAYMGFWGSVWAAAEAELVETDAFYRQWRAQQAKEIMAKEPKLAVTKIDSKIDAHPQFTLLKEAIAKAKSNVTLCRTHFESFRTKANILQSKGAMYRAEFDSTNMKTKSNATDEEKLNKMRNLNQGE